MEIPLSSGPPVDLSRVINNPVIITENGGRGSWKKPSITVSTVNQSAASSVDEEVSAERTSGKLSFEIESNSNLITLKPITPPYKLKPLISVDSVSAEDAKLFSPVGRRNSRDETATTPTRERLGSGDNIMVSPIQKERKSSRGENIVIRDRQGSGDKLTVLSPTNRERRNSRDEIVTTPTRSRLNSKDFLVLTPVLNERKSIHESMATPRDRLASGDGATPRQWDRKNSRDEILSPRLRRSSNDTIVVHERVGVSDTNLLTPRTRERRNSENSPMRERLGSNENIYLSPRLRERKNSKDDGINNRERFMSGEALPVLDEESVERNTSGKVRSLYGDATRSTEFYSSHEGYESADSLGSPVKERRNSRDIRDRSEMNGSNSPRTLRERIGSGDSFMGSPGTVKERKNAWDVGSPKSLGRRTSSDNVTDVDRFSDLINKSQNRSITSPSNVGGSRRRTSTQEWIEETSTATKKSPMSMLCTSVVLNFLTANTKALTEHDDDAIFALENLICETLEKEYNDKTDLLSLLQTYGWDDDCFRRTENGQLELFSLERLVQDCSSLYLLSSVSDDVSVERYWCDRTNGFVNYTLDNDAMVKCYCPDLLCKFLGSMHPNEQPTDMSVSSMTFTGACVLVDISGFTKLSSSLCSEGSTGLDKLHRVTNGFLGHLVQLVYHYEGDVVYFAGDALICVFQSNRRKPRVSGFPGSIESHDDFCLLRALKCSVAIKDYEANQLTTHIAISCGEMHLAWLGGQNGLWTFLLNGSCISELRCIDEAPKKEVVMTDEFVSRVESMLVDYLDDESKSTSYFRTRKLESGNHLLDSFRLRTTFPPPCSRFTGHNRTGSTVCGKLRQFVPKTVLNSIEAGSALKKQQLTAELREVTTLFCSLDTYSPELYADPVSLQMFVLCFQEAVYETGGYQRQFLIDDKGCVLIVMWGVPSATYSDNSSRAIDCASSIISRASGFGHKCSVGITTGTVFCGSIGCTIRRDYVGIGSTVNLAARLMGKAHGRILVDETTFKKLSPLGQSQFVLGEPLKLKGIEDDFYPYAVPASDVIFLPRLCSENQNKASSFVVRADIANQIEDVIEKLAQVCDQYEDCFSPELPCRMCSKLTIDNEDDDSSNDNEFNVNTGASNNMMRLVSQDSKSNLDAIFTEPVDLLNEAQLDDYTKFREKFVNMYEKNQAVKGSVSFTLVRGPPGCGKSVTCKHFRYVAQDHGVPAVTVAAKSGDDGMVYGVVLKLLVEIIGKVNCKTSPQRHLVLSDLLRVSMPGLSDSDFQLRLRRLKRLLIENMKGSVIKLVGNDLRDDSLSIVLTTALRAYGGIGIIIEDAQFCDELSWQVLRNLQKSNVNVAFLLTIRSSVIGKSGKVMSNAQSTVASPSISSRLKLFGTSEKTGDGRTPTYGLKNITSKSFMSIISQPSCASFELYALSLNDVKKLLSDATRNCEGDAVVSYELIDYVFELSQGNPFWCKAIISHILEQGIDSFTKAIISGDAGNALDVLVLCRFEKLNHIQQNLVKYASVIGFEFCVSDVQGILPDLHISDTMAETQFAYLIGAGFLYLDDMASHTFTFQNKLIRDVIYDLIPPSDAAGIHQTFARYLEKDVRNISLNSARISYHFTIGKCRVEAFKYACKAAENAFQRGDTGEGLAYADTARSMMTSAPEARSVLKIVNNGMSEANSRSIMRRMSSFVGLSAGSPLPLQQDDTREYLRLRALLEEEIEDLRVEGDDEVITSGLKRSASQLSETLRNGMSQMQESFRGLLLKGESYRIGKKDDEDTVRIRKNSASAVSSNDELNERISSPLKNKPSNAKGGKPTSKIFMESNLEGAESDDTTPNKEMNLVPLISLGNWKCGCYCG